MARSKVARIDDFSRSNLGYAIGYQDAANLIIDSLDNYAGHPDLLFFPLAFLYRHATELVLKNIIYIGISLAGGQHEVVTGHNLGHLWQRAREYLLEHPDGSDGSYFDSIDSSIDRLHSIDPRSETFRYVIDKDRNITLPDDEWIDLDNLKNDMDDLINKLTACVDYLGELRSSGP